MRKWLRLCLALATSAGSGWAVDWKALRPQGFVNDFAGSIDAGAKAQLEQYCAEVEHATGTRILLVILGSLENEPLEDVARTIFEAWRDPQPARDQRVLVLLTIADRRRYVLAGNGLDPRTADGLAGRVLREMRPALRSEDYPDALRAAAETVGNAVAAGARVRLGARLPRVHRESIAEELPWLLIAGGVMAVTAVILAARFSGHIGFVGRRSTWGSRGSGGFGGYDSGDPFGGFGGAGCKDW